MGVIDLQRAAPDLFFGEPVVIIAGHFKVLAHAVEMPQGLTRISFLAFRAAHLSYLLKLFDEVADAARIVFSVAAAFDGVRPSARIDSDR